MAAALLSGCAAAISPRSVPRATPQDIAAAPADWDGREVEVSGLIAWEFENLGLWQDYESYCGFEEKSAIAVDWDEWPGITRSDNRRLVTVRGIFRNIVHVKQPDGGIVISTGAPGPGPLQAGSIVRWHSETMPPCA